MKELLLENGKKVSLSTNGVIVKTGEITFGFTYLKNVNKFSQKYQIDVLYDENDVEFEKEIKAACKVAFDLAKKNNSIPRNANIKEFTESPFKVVKAEKLNEDIQKIYSGKKCIVSSSKYKIPVYNMDGKLVSPKNVKLGSKGAVILHISAYNCGINKGFTAYLKKVLVQKEDMTDEQALTFFDDGTPLEVPDKVITDPNKVMVDVYEDSDVPF